VVQDSFIGSLQSGQATTPISSRLHGMLEWVVGMTLSLHLGGSITARPLVTGIYRSTMPLAAPCRLDMGQTTFPSVDHIMLPGKFWRVSRTDLEQFALQVGAFKQALKVRLLRPKQDSWIILLAGAGAVVIIARQLADFQVFRP